MAYSTSLASYAGCFLWCSYEAVRIHIVTLTTPLPFHSVLACHALYKLTYKVSERVFKVFFPETVNRYSNNSVVIPSRFKLFNSCLATGTSSLLLHLAKKPILIRTMLIYRVYMSITAVIIPSVTVLFVIALYLVIKKISVLALATHNYLFPLKIHETLTNKQNAEKIEELIKEISKKNTCYDFIQNLDQELVDAISLLPHSLPVKIDATHYLDKESLLGLARFNKKGQKECPICREKLILQAYTVSTEIQEKILKKLKEIYRNLQM